MGEVAECQYHKWIINRRYIAAGQPANRERASASVLFWFNEIGDLLARLDRFIFAPSLRRKKAINSRVQA